MPGTRARLINAARRSMIQRAELQRKLGFARHELAPKALVDRGKNRVQEKLDDTAHAVRQQFRNNRLPIALAAVAGVAWLLREPIREHAPRVGRKLRDLADLAIDYVHPAADAKTDMEEDDETAE